MNGPQIERLLRPASRSPLTQDFLRKVQQLKEWKRLGCRLHSSVVSSVPTIIRPRVQIPCTPSTLISICMIEKNENKWKRGRDLPIFKKRLKTAFTKESIVINKFSVAMIGREPWYSGNGRRLIFWWSSWVRIPALYTGWTFFTTWPCWSEALWSDETSPWACNIQSKRFIE